MAQYKGVQVSDALAGLLRHMDEVDEHREALQVLQGAWDNLAMLGELSGMGVQISGVRGAFGELTTRLLNHLGEQALRKASLALQSQAHVAADILVRNLFERTADIGFLATDQALRSHAEASEAERLAGRSALVARLHEYQRKYSVYDDVVLLAPDGSVLARLDERAQVAVSHDPLVRDALASREPYIERYGSTDLRPGAGPSLIYACPVMAADGRRPVAVLCLCFDLTDECRRIFAALRNESDWAVIALLDPQGAVIASSDALQLPTGAQVGLGALGQGEGAGGARVLRFAGRRWLALSCPAQPYQGYAGPGWYGHAMLPLEHAFEAGGAAGNSAGGGAGGGAADPAASASLALSAPVQAALMASPRLFSDALRDIAPSADRIEAELKRVVWNGNVALGAQAAGRDAQFSRTLLREIGRAGTRTREVFTRAIGNMNRTVISAMVEDSRSRAALAIDIMDRNLYERANDCRWWALTALFREALAAPEIDAATHTALAGVLKTIHGLYTVYANLMLFDRSGRIVAVSRADAGAAVGQTLSQDWVRQCLATTDGQGYTVSPYEASELYGGELTCIYAAAVRAPGDAGRVVGGIAIVFDATPQFTAMLADTVHSEGAADGSAPAASAAGRDGAGAFAVFVEPDGRVIASSRADLAPGSGLPAELLPPASDAGGARVVRFEQHLYALGSCRSSGYREFSPAAMAPGLGLGTSEAGRCASYRHQAAALVFVPLAHADAAAGGSAAEAAPAPVPLALPVALANGEGREVVELASFAVAGQWYGVPCEAVLEAVVARQITPLARGDARLRGTVLHRGQAIAVFDLGAVLQADAVTPATGPVIVLRASAGRPAFGLLVDALGDHLQAAAARLERLDKLYPQGHPVVESLLRAPQDSGGSGMLMVLSPERLASELAGAPLLVAA